MEKKQRQSNIELLRIVLMLMIITHHMIAHGLGLIKIGQPGFIVDRNTYYELFINSFVLISVNAFIFISGFFGMKFKVRTVVSFILQALCYSISIYLVFILFHHSLWDLKSFVKCFLPIGKDEWWFLTVYLALYFIAPFLNMGMEYIEHRQMIFLLAGLLYLDCYAGFVFNTLSGGHSIFHFATIYLIGRYMNKYAVNIKWPFVFLLTGTLMIFGGTLILLYLGKVNMVWKYFYHNNPLQIATAIMLFYVFKNIKIQSKLVNICSGAVFGVYLIHDHELVRNMIIQFFTHVKMVSPAILFLGIIPAMVILIFTVTTGIELVRKYFFDKLIDKISLSYQSRLNLK